MKQTKSPLSRRGFLKGSATAAALLSMPRWTARSYAQIVGANSDIRVAMIGCRDKGRGLNDQIRQLSGVRLVAICDPDQAILDGAMARLATAPGGRRGRGAAPATVPTASASPSPVTQYIDVRKLLENRDVDSIFIATPNHWHALMTIWGCQAGKDVYVEKPISHNIWEGQQMLAAEKKYNRIVETGTQWRSMPQVYEALEFAKTGNLGKITLARGFCYKRRESIGKTDGPQPVASSVNYDLWCGPAPMDPLRRGRLHYDWHWVWSTGNGDVANQGAHQMDLARWVLNKSTLAPTAVSIGGRLGYVDDAETPNTMVTVHDYGDTQIIFEVRGLPTKTGAGADMDEYKGVGIGNVVECEGGYVTTSTALCAAFDKSGKQIRQFNGADVQRDRNHVANFFKVMRSRRPQELNADLRDGHVSTSLSHVSNISYRLGQKADPDALKAAFKANPAATEALDRLTQHLAANEIKLDTEKATLGVPLKVDPVTERFTNNDAANAMLTRDYRAPYVVPKTV